MKPITIANAEIGVEAKILPLGAAFRLVIRDTDAGRVVGTSINYPTLERATRAAYAAVDLPEPKDVTI